MKFESWTLGLAAVGLVSIGATSQAEEAQHSVMTALSSTTISGSVDTSAILRFGRGDISPGRSFDGADKQDGFNLNVVRLQLEKPLDVSNWSVGYNVGLLFGPDANTYGTTSSRTDLKGIQTAGVPRAVDNAQLQNLLHGNSDFGIKEASVTLRAPLGYGLDFKIGYWESPIGYEVFDAGSNPNYSRSFGYYVEPKQFTGVLATYRISSVVQIAGGIANQGWALLRGPCGSHTVLHVPMTAINSRSGLASLLTYLGSIAITVPDSAGFLKGATFFGGIIDSSIYSGPDVVNYYVGGTIPTPLKNLAVGAAWDYRANSAGEGFSSSYASAVSGYLTYQMTEKLKLNGRVEYAVGSNNTWVYFANGSHNEVLGVTASVDYNLWAHALTRLEFRWDHDLTGNGMFNDVNNLDQNALSLALNVIYKF